MKQFDLVRAAFLLVTFVIASHVVIVFAVVGVCLWHVETIIEGNFKCDADNRLAGLLAEALAAALAFGGSRGRPPEN
jgi:hypothetical protein